MAGELRIGTCSWKYPSWEGLVYSRAKGINFLEEYARSYDTVEIDQWFWSLFAPDKVVLPIPRTVAEYAASVGPEFRFTVKAPNSITLTHLYRKGSRAPLRAPLEANPHFLSVDLLRAFLAALEPLGPTLGVVMFQFEYLNRQKMASLEEFLGVLKEFFDAAPGGYRYAVEVRNPQYLCERYFSFLGERNLAPVFLQGYYMPGIEQYYPSIRHLIRGEAVVRLHGRDRAGIEEKTGGDWSRVVNEAGEELPAVVETIRDLLERTDRTYLNVNNHYEGSAPITIRKIRELLDSPQESSGAPR